ncbi:P-loop containing nucleoside triphosphate hydrolase protein [Rozella allomycis CSF55]|uniref:Midasin n=1 Tax=Rozella allomycis (strain CSF55) TaxID=988480 RepID=A0A4V1IZE9_ROZAC|nr:P-loop containing nucleoside triphosphate hydrolase protein [Rozella allomycis CSF55]
MKKNALLFGFVEGALLKAIRQGQWVLLDEVNLASSETLQVLSGLLQDNKGSITLTERGDVEPIPRNENFRLFACMNPSNDIGKKDLPPALRSKFTEIFVDEIDCYKKDLEIIVGKYLNKFGHYEQWLLGSIVEFYYRVKKAPNLYDTDNKKPHFSMRTLTRALSFAISVNKNYPILKCVYEGICVSFTTQLNEESFKIMNEIINSTILLKRNISQCNIVKNDDESKCLIEGYLIDKGNFEIQEENNSFILTRSVKNNLKNLARAVQCKKYPILIQGPTSVGKSSIIKYLADLTGNKFVRINNHEHTDIQEYFGSYVNDSTGKLVYKQGILVEAVKNGYWIVLDELNLAPTEVLESLNRLLDDNREIFLPETQETIKAHPNFILFATQNPPGMYGGRKTLSKAFRNRFLELHFDNIPSDEMEEILSKKCIVAPSYCKKMVLVYQELIDKRPKSKIFSGKHGFITLRDLFKWAERNPNSYQELAEIGYMLLAERIRDVDEKGIVKKVLEQVIKVEINEDDLYDLELIKRVSRVK